jgi:hypothetical protein
VARDHPAIKPDAAGSGPCLLERDGENRTRLPKNAFLETKLVFTTTGKGLAKWFDSPTN